ncbi:MAG: DUF2948 family protein [Alphaproteobacteria bacterium]|nr:DUF2948 family protein [Alphaproteobacteria bacterium]
MATPGTLKLRAGDVEDLTVMSSMLQDAVTQVGDLAWLAEQRRFALLVSRYCWECCKGGPVGQRVLAGLHFEFVRGVKSIGIPRQHRHATLELLSLRCEPLADGGVAVSLDFAGGAELRIEADRLAAYLADRPDTLHAAPRPEHKLEAGG